MAKRCGKCNKYKAYGEFYTRIDSYQSYCIECIKRYNKENREVNRKFKNEVYQDVCKNLPSEDQIVVVNMAKRFAFKCKGISDKNALELIVAIGHWMNERNISGVDLRNKYGDEPGER